MPIEVSDMGVVSRNGKSMRSHKLSRRYGELLSKSSKNSRKTRKTAVEEAVPGKAQITYLARALSTDSAGWRSRIRPFA
jgi:hypothetical protein